MEASLPTEQTATRQAVTKKVSDDDNTLKPGGASTTDSDAQAAGRAAHTGTAEEYDALYAAYEASLRTITALPELPMRRAALDRTISELTTEEAVWWIDQLLRGALWGRNPELDAMMACADWLIRLRAEDDYARLQALFKEAHTAGRESVVMLLRDPPPKLEMPKKAKLPEVNLQMGREITLGERRSLARGRDKRLLERLLMDPSPLVLEKLLDNPNVRNDDVLIVASRRPTKPQLLQTVVFHKRWFRELVIREALVFNPYTPTGISLKLLPTLPIQLLRRVRDARDLHEILQQSAEMFVSLREERTAPWRV
jgi:hypothetical protein